MNNTNTEFRATQEDQLSIIERALATPEELSFNLNQIWDQVQEYKSAIRSFNVGMRYPRLDQLEADHRTLMSRLRGEALDRDELAAKAMLVALRERAKRIRDAMKTPH